MLKGPWRKIFNLRFFPQTSPPPRSLIHGLKPCWICLRIRGENWQSWLHYAVSMTPLYNQPCWIYSWMNWNTVFYAVIWLSCTGHSGVIDTPMTLWLAQQCQWYRCDMHISVNDTPVQIWHWCDLGHHILAALATFNGNICRKTCIGKLFYTISITFTQKMGGLTKDGFLSQRCNWLRFDLYRLFYSRFSLQVRGHIQKGFSPCTRVINLMSGSL
jgi:hypothetical protein